MYIKNSIATLSVFGMLAVGYLAGSVFGLPNTDSSMLQGDINKAKAYNQPDSPEVQAAMEQLANDTTLQQQTAVAAAVLEGRIKEMKDILNTYAPKDTIDFPDNSEDPSAPWWNSLLSLQKRADNAQEEFSKYTEAMVAVINGEKVENFEQTANNALLAYTIADKQMKAAAPIIITSLTEMAEKNNDQKAAELAAKLIQYNAEDAILEDSKEQQDFWQGQYETLSNRCKGLNIVGGYTGDANTLFKNILPGKMETYITKSIFALRSNSISLLKTNSLRSNSITLLKTNILRKTDSKLLNEWYGGSYEITLANSPKDFLCNSVFITTIHPVVPAIREPRQ